ncbi:hypothetical protein UPYG_G00138610 [Umbra pygmaea]|uniref:Uncharacterized protein n=1 Tax=Umbra pygmaea TaxID=75934 RepID=A0ABD0WZB4_UMBPY
MVEQNWPTVTAPHMAEDLKPGCGQQREREKARDSPPDLYIHKALCNLCTANFRGKGPCSLSTLALCVYILSENRSLNSC